MATNKPKLTRKGNKVMREFERAVAYYEVTRRSYTFDKVDRYNDSEAVSLASKAYKRADKNLREYLFELESK